MSAAHHKYLMFPGAKLSWLKGSQNLRPPARAPRKLRFGQAGAVPHTGFFYGRSYPGPKIGRGLRGPRAELHGHGVPIAHLLRAFGDDDGALFQAADDLDFAWAPATRFHFRSDGPAVANHEDEFLRAFGNERLLRQH